MNFWKKVLTAGTLAGHFVFAGIMFGWGSLQVIFEEEGILNDVCGDMHSCPAQKAKLNLVYTISSTIFMFGAFFSGIVIDIYGPTIVSSAGGACITLSMLMFGLAGKQDEGMYIIAGSLSGIGSSLVYICGFSLGCLVGPESVSIVMTSLNCLFDASACVFLLFYYMYEAGFSRRELFVGLSVFSFVLYGIVAVLWYVHEEELYAIYSVSAADKSSYGAVGMETEIDANGEGNLVIGEGAKEQALGTDTEVGLVEMTDVVVNDPSNSPVSRSPEPLLKNDKKLCEDINSKSVSMVNPRIKSMEFAHNLPLFSLLGRAPFLFILGFGAMNILRANTFFGTIFDLLSELGDNERGYMYTQILFLLLPLSFVFIPVIEFIMVRYGLMGCFRIVLLFGFVYGVVELIPILEIQVISFVFFCLFRAMLFSSLGAYFVNFYGVKSAGRMYGAMSLFASGVNFLQYPAFVLITIYDGGRVFYITLFMLLLTFPSIALVETLLRQSLHRYPFADTLKVP